MYLAYCTRKSFQTAVLGSVGTIVDSGMHTLFLYVLALLISTFGRTVHTFPDAIRI
jgi:hypothetical protein